MEPARSFRTAYARRRGGIYMAVLGAAMLVTVIGMAALAAARGRRQTAQLAIDSAEARLYAESAVELAIGAISADSSWRTNHASGVWYTNRPLDDGTFTISVVDPLDNNLSNRPSDPIVVTGTGTKGAAVQMV